LFYIVEDRIRLAPLAEREGACFAVSRLCLEAILIEVEVITIDIFCLDSFELVLRREEIRPKRYAPILSLQPASKNGVVVPAEIAGTGAPLHLMEVPRDVLSLLLHFFLPPFFAMVDLATCPPLFPLRFLSSRA
jgi:hypothetical protein